MNKYWKYRETDSMSDLICENYPILLVISRFGIALGVGDKSIGEVCRENRVDTATFLTVVNMLLDRENYVDTDNSQVSLPALMDYLHNSHEYFLDFRLPAIRSKLVSTLAGDGSDLARAIILYFDQYVSEVRKHMTYEEKTLFPYIRSLIKGDRSGKYNIATFSKQHDHVEARLTEFKHIIIKYYPVRNTNEINSVLFDIFSCESDLASHNAVEDRLLVPIVEKMEKECK